LSSPSRGGSGTADLIKQATAAGVEVRHVPEPALQGKDADPLYPVWPAPRALPGSEMRNHS